jgi:hypothetical protein
MKRCAIAMFVAASLQVGGCAVHADDTSDSTLTVSNRSDYEIEDLFITLHHSSRWGSDFLGDQPLRPGEVIVLDHLPCDTYDVLIVDETDAECEVDAISLCFDDADWVITNNTCDVFGAR